MSKNYLDFKRSKDFPYMRDIVIDEIYKAAKKNRDIFFATPDMGAPSLDEFRVKIPKQFVHCGISEQQMISFAGGLALMKKKIFCYAMSPFINSRCYEQIKCSISAMDLKVNLIAVGVGTGYADAGPTHYSTEDICIMKVFPNITIYTPSDDISAVEIAKKIINKNHFNYLRLDRDALPSLYKTRSFNFDQGYNFISKKNNKVCIVTCGYLTHKAIKINETLKGKVDIIDLFRIKPFPKKILNVLKKYKVVVTLEEQLAAGGFGATIQEEASNNNIKINIKKFCLDDKFYFENGGRDYLHSKYGLSSDKIKNFIKKI